MTTSPSIRSAACAAATAPAPGLRRRARHRPRRRGRPITALLGTNGAGKTSTLEVIEGLAPAERGRGPGPRAWTRRRPRAVRRRTGVLLQRAASPATSRSAETLRMWAPPRPRPGRSSESLAEQAARPRPTSRVRGAVRRRAAPPRPGLRADRRPRGGPPRRADHRPRPGEPSRGVGPGGGLRDRGRAVLLTTHYLEEAEALADQVAIMHAGPHRPRGTPAEIVAGHPSTDPLRAHRLPSCRSLPGGRASTEARGTTTVADRRPAGRAHRPAGLGRRHGRAPGQPRGPDRHPRVGVPAIADDGAPTTDEPTEPDPTDADEHRRP